MQGDACVGRWMGISEGSPKPTEGEASGGPPFGPPQNRFQLVSLARFSEAAEMQGEWIQQPGMDSAIIFVHGFLSSAESCWRNENGCFWPQLLANEPALKGVGIYSYTYSTGIFSGNYRLSDVVDDLKERIRLDDIIKCKKLLFVCHSMGGIVARKLLVERAMEFSERKSDMGLFLLASPSLGSTYADMLASLARSVGNSQADALRFVRHNLWLNDLDKEFNNLKESKRIQIAGKELIEDKFLVLRKFWRRQIVEPFSGARYFGEPYKVPGSDHFSIAKPSDGRAIQHRLLCRFIGEMGIAQIDDTSLTETRNPYSLETLVAEHPILSAAQSEIESSSGLSGAVAASLLSSGIPSDTLAEFYLIMARRVSGKQLFMVAVYALDLMDKSGVGHSTVEYCLEHLDQDLTELVAQRMRKVVSEAAIIWCHKQLNFLNSYGVIDTPSAARVVDVIDVSQYRRALTELSNDFADQFEQILSRFMVRVHCDKIFVDERDAAGREADTVTRISEVRVLTDDAKFYRSNLTVANGSIVPTVWSVRNHTRNKDIPIRALALENGADRQQMATHCLIQFIDPKTHFTKDDVLEIRGVYSCVPPSDMNQLNFKRGDFFGFSNIATPTIRTAEIVLVYPKTLGPLQVSTHPVRSTRKDGKLLDFDRDYRLALGEKVDVLGLTVEDLETGQTLFAQVTQVY